MFRQLFFLFADRKTALLEMALKKANLEDIFLELTESTDTATQPEESEAKEA